MSRDLFERMAVIPNQIDDFNEVWCVVNRANGRMVERFVRRLKESDCGGTRILLDEQVFMDSTVSFEDGQAVTQISVTNGVLYTITSPAHGYSDSDTVVLRNVAGATQLSNTKWVIGNVTTDTFDLLIQVI